MRSAAHTAKLVALLVQRSGERRSRISETTLKLLSGRTRLQPPFIVQVMQELAAMYNISMIGLDVGGFGVVSAKSLEGAKAITTKRFFSEHERRLTQAAKPFPWDEIDEELGLNASEDEEDGNEDANSSD